MYLQTWKHRYAQAHNKGLTPGLMVSQTIRKAIKYWTRFRILRLLIVSDCFATPWTVARQAPLSVGFSRGGLPRRPPGDLPDPGMEPASLTFPALGGGFFTTSANWEAQNVVTIYDFSVSLIVKGKKYLWPVCPWTSYSVSLGLSFLTCKIGVIVILASQDYY